MLRETNDMISAFATLPGWRPGSRSANCPEQFTGIGSACFTPDGQWVFWVELDDSWRPLAVWRHRVGTAVESDVCVYRETDERFWVGVGISFDERNIVIGTGSKTTTEVLMLPVATPEGEFQAFIPRQNDIEYDVSFACFEGAGENGADVPLAVVYHNAANPNFEIDVIDMRGHEPPYRLGEGVCIAAGSPYGCEHGEPDKPITEAYFNAVNPAILQGAHGLGIEGIALHRNFVSLSYRADGQPHVALHDQERGCRRLPGRTAVAVYGIAAACPGGRLGHGCRRSRKLHRRSWRNLVDRR